MQNFVPKGLYIGDERYTTQECVDVLTSVGMRVDHFPLPTDFDGQNRLCCAAANIVINKFAKMTEVTYSGGQVVGCTRGRNGFLFGLSIDKDWTIATYAVNRKPPWPRAPLAWKRVYLMIQKHI